MKKRSSQSSETRSKQAIEKKKILIAFGTRPEAIKLCPLIKELEKREKAQVRVCISSQHKELLRGVLDDFGVRADYDLGVMSTSQTLFDVTERVLERIREVLSREMPDVVVVHGDTTTAFAASLACFYMNIPVAHVEAGLRTKNIRSPFPEEFNRRAIALTARYHFAPTMSARQNLLREGIDGENIFVTGNTVIDALSTTVSPHFAHPLLDGAIGKRIIFFTAHRRENICSLEDMLRAVFRLVEKYPDVLFIYPVHPNPRVRDVAERVLGRCDGVKLCSPLGVYECHNILARSYLVLTDSGGLQEEAAALGVPVLVMRDETERCDGIKLGISALVGTKGHKIFEKVCEILDNSELRERMSCSENPYGDGNASKAISDVLLI